MADNNNTETETAVTPQEATKPAEAAAKAKAEPAPVDEEVEKLRKNLKIKTGVVKRLTKDKVCYLKEAEEQEKKIEKFKAEGKEELFIRQQEGNLKETQMMIPDVARMLGTAYKALNDLLPEVNETLKESEEYKTAVKTLEEAEPHLSRNPLGQIRDI